MATSAVLGACANAPEKEDWGLVYDGAITENVAGQVNLLPVKYDLRGITVAANVYTPAGYDPAKTYAAVVVALPNGGVKEQVAGRSPCPRGGRRSCGVPCRHGQHDSRGSAEDSD